MRAYSNDYMCHSAPHPEICRSLAQTTCMHVSLSLPQPPIRLTDKYVPHHNLALRKGTTSSPPRGLNQSTQFFCSRALRVLMTSCACHSIPVCGAPIAIHPVLTASLRTNKMAHVCREDSVDTYLGAQIPNGQVVTMALHPKGQDAVQTHTHTPISTHTHSLSL